MNFSVNLTTLFTEVPFLERFKKANDFGFSYVECQFPYAYSVNEIQQQLNENGLLLDLINLPAGEWEKGDRGLAIDPGRTNEFRHSVEHGIQYATNLGVQKIHCMAGIILPYIEKETARETYIRNIYEAGRRMDEFGITLLIEPINPFSMPNYYLNNIEDAIEIMNGVNLQNVKLQFDFFHIHRIHGNPLFLFKKYFEYIDHIQIADSPERNQPGTGEMDYGSIFKAIHEIGYKGQIGLEYTPQGTSEESFGWITGTEKGGTTL